MNQAKTSSWIHDTRIALTTALLLIGCGACGTPEAEGPKGPKSGPGVELVAWPEDRPPRTEGCLVRALRDVEVQVVPGGAAILSQPTVSIELQAGEVAHLYWRRDREATNDGRVWLEVINFGVDGGPQGWASAQLAKTDDTPVELAHDYVASPLPQPVEDRFELAVRVVGQGAGTPKTIRPRPSGARVLPALPEGAVTLAPPTVTREGSFDVDALRSVLRLELVVRTLDG